MVNVCVSCDKPFANNNGQLVPTLPQLFCRFDLVRGNTNCIHLHARREQGALGDFSPWLDAECGYEDSGHDMYDHDESQGFQDVVNCARELYLYRDSPRFISILLLDSHPFPSPFSSYRYPIKR